MFSLSIFYEGNIIFYLKQTLYTELVKRLSFCSLSCFYQVMINFLNMLIRAYSLITNKITRSFNIVLLGGINNTNRYIIKIYWYFCHTFHLHLLEMQPEYQYIFIIYWLALLIPPSNTMFKASCYFVCD